MTTELNKSSSGYWSLYFPDLPVDDMLGRDFVLNIFGTGIPSLSLTPYEQGWMGGKIKMPTSKLEFSDWTFNFIIDEKLFNWQAIFKWITLINNNNDKFLEEYPKYCVSPILRVLDNFRQPTLNLRFINAWPIRLGDVTLNTKQDESVLEGQCTFAFDRYEYETYEG